MGSHVSLRDRISALENELVADPADMGPIVVRTVDARAEGRGLLPDDDVICLRAADGTVTPRLPSESLPELIARAAAAAPAWHRRRRPVLMAVYASARDDA